MLNTPSAQDLQRQFTTGGLGILKGLSFVNHTGCDRCHLNQPLLSDRIESEKQVRSGTLKIRVNNLGRSISVEMRLASSWMGIALIGCSLKNFSQENLEDQFQTDASTKVRLLVAAHFSLLFALCNESTLNELGDRTAKKGNKRRISIKKSIYHLTGSEFELQPLDFSIVFRSLVNFSLQNLPFFQIPKIDLQPAKCLEVS